MQSTKNGARYALLSVIFSVLVLYGRSIPADDFTLTMTELSNWLDAYGEAWESRDADAAVRIFSEDASYRVTPYEEPHAGRSGIHDYWAGVTENQRNVRFEHQALSVSGNTGIAHWSAKFNVEPDGTKLELDGIFVLEFDQDGNCRRLREWWHLNSPGTDEGN